MNGDPQFHATAIKLVAMLAAAVEKDRISQALLDQAEAEVESLELRHDAIMDLSERQRTHDADLIRQLRQQLSDQAVSNRYLEGSLQATQHRLGVETAKKETWHYRYQILEEERRDNLDLVTRLQTENRQLRTEIWQQSGSIPEEEQTGCLVSDTQFCPSCGGPNLVSMAANQFRCPYCSEVFGLDIDETL